MELIDITLALLLAVAAVAAIGKWVGAPLPVLLVAGGVCLSFLPGYRSLRIEPDIFFLLFIPPLLFSDAWLIPKRDLLKVMRPVLLLAFGLVFLTVVAVGYLMHWLIPDLPLAAAFALGAVISPTDAVAVRAITSRLSIPSRVSTIIDGESLINDASGLIAFKFAIAAAMTGAFSWSGAILEFFVASGGGFLLGLAIAWAIGQARVGLRRFCADDPTIQTVISLLTPYAAYLAAEALGVGSILAVVGAGLYAGAHDLRHLDAATRAHSWEVWRMVLFAFNGLVFVLLGVQLHSIIGALSRASALELAGYAMALSAAVIALRIVWVFPAAYLPLLLSKRVREREGIHSPRAVFFTGWAGIRGSITLAAALSIPFATSTGAPFPGRELIILLAACVIIVTLLANGLSLPLLIRWLDIRGDRIAEREERAARIATAQAAIDALRKRIPTLKTGDETAFAKSLLAQYEQRFERYSADAERKTRLDAQFATQRRIWLATIAAERAELMQMRETDIINDEVLRRLQVDLDLEETRVVGAGRNAA
ncbi:MAG: Na+/H+ antiporter [Casimicrobiaceae bacterium]